MKVHGNRKRGRITLSEFRQHRDSGLGIKVMPKTLGVSKSHVQFLSALDQGKFDHVTKDQFKSDYLSGMSLVEISKKYNVSKDYIGFLREHFNIPRLGPKFINRKKTEKPLTTRQKELIYGSLMGDAGRMSPSSVKMKQSIKQKEYLLWKFNELQEHVSLKSLQEESYFDKRYNAKYSHIRFYTHANTDVESIIKKFYTNQKTITQDILDQLTTFSIAVWFMDDGTTDWNRRSGYNANPVASLCTDSFSKEECELICEWFQQKWNVSPYVRARSKTENPLYRVIFSTTETPKLFDLIRPYIIPSMMYKIEYNHTEGDRYDS